MADNLPEEGDKLNESTHTYSFGRQSVETIKLYLARKTRKSKIWQYLVLIFGTISAMGALMWTIFASVHYNSPNLVKDRYCYENKAMKEEDILDDPKSICNSTIVLAYKPEEMGPTLRGVYLAQAVVGALLSVTSVLAVAGACACRLRAPRLVLVWGLTALLWCVVMLICCGVLSKFGFLLFRVFMAVAAVAYLIPQIITAGFWMSERKEDSNGEIEMNSRDENEDDVDGKSSTHE